MQKYARIRLAMCTVRNKIIAAYLILFVILWQKLFDWFADFHPNRDFALRASCCVLMNLEYGCRIAQARIAAKTYNSL
jgi:hypothetical protein